MPMDNLLNLMHAYYYEHDYVSYIKMWKNIVVKFALYNYS